MKFAAIDIGSNAVRLLFCNVVESKGKTLFKKAELIRVPIRLGEEAFLKGELSEKKIVKLIEAMKAFKHLINVYDAVDYRACATSAMREAKNGQEVVERVKKESGINIEIIDGRVEADMIYANDITGLLDLNSAYLYIDIGGGSTELTLFANHKLIASHSFNIGTIRVLHDKVTNEQWEELRSWVEVKTQKYKPVIGIGSGGNINKLFKMSHKKPNKPITFKKLKELYDNLASFTIEERIAILGLNPDRADVIEPAGRIVLAVMKAAEIEKLMVPQIGLSDGIVHLLYSAHKQKEGAQLSVH